MRDSGKPKAPQYPKLWRRCGLIQSGFRDPALMFEYRYLFGIAPFVRRLLS
jgi:hypothetical protein